ncbi:MAG: macro domain-containing protein [Muribaculaceae bacterium]
MVRYIEKGDIFRLEGVTSYAHGCNCAGAMGKGIAVSFKQRLPEMYAEYKELCRNGQFKPGDVFDYDYGIGHVYNLGTQQTWRTRARLEYIEQSVARMMEMSSSEGVQKIAMPAIGAGLGGLRWADVRDVIEKAAGSNPSVELIVVENYSPE